ncbi:V-type proton ATPase subunit A3-like protein [Tanacetum coccineum]
MRVGYEDDLEAEQQSAGLKNDIQTLERQPVLNSHQAASMNELTKLSDQFLLMMHLKRLKSREFLKLEGTDQPSCCKGLGKGKKETDECLSWWGYQCPYAVYMPNRPPQSRSVLPEPRTTDYDELETNPTEKNIDEMNLYKSLRNRTGPAQMPFFVVSFQAGEFFKAAQSIAAAQHSEASSQQAAEDSLETPLLKDQDSTDQSKQVKLGFLTGLVPKGRALAFERILFRATRGNVFLRQSSVDVIDPTSGEKVEKNVFVVFFSGERAKSKILKICEAFGANRYPYAEDLGKQTQMITEVLTILLFYLLEHSFPGQSYLCSLIVLLSLV